MKGGMRGKDRGVKAGKVGGKGVNAIMELELGRWMAPGGSTQLSLKQRVEYSRLGNTCHNGVYLYAGKCIGVREAEEVT